MSLNRENRKKAEEKNTLSGQIEPLASLTAHLLCFCENGSLPSDNKNHGGKKHIIFFRRCCLPLLAATWAATQKAGNAHFGHSFVWIAFLFVHKHTDFLFSFIPRRRRRHGTTERLQQSNDLIAGEEEKKAKAVISLYNIYLVVKWNYTQTQGCICHWVHKGRVTSSGCLSKCPLPFFYTKYYFSYGFFIH